MVTDDTNGDDMARVLHRLTPRRVARARNADHAELLSALDHELRTPLTTIQGYTELLLDEAAGALTEPQREMLARVHENAERLGATIAERLPTVCRAVADEVARSRSRRSG